MFGLDVCVFFTVHLFLFVVLILTAAFHAYIIIFLDENSNESEKTDKTCEELPKINASHRDWSKAVRGVSNRPIRDQTDDASSNHMSTSASRKVGVKGWRVGWLSRKKKGILHLWSEFSGEWRFHCTIIILCKSILRESLINTGMRWRACRWSVRRFPPESEHMSAVTV